MEAVLWDHTGGYDPGLARAEEIFPAPKSAMRGMLNKRSWGVGGSRRGVPGVDWMCEPAKGHVQIEGVLWGGFLSNRVPTPLASPRLISCRAPPWPNPTRNKMARVLLHLLGNHSKPDRQKQMSSSGAKRAKNSIPNLRSQLGSVS